MIGNLIELIFEFFNLFSNGNGKKKNDKEAKQHFKNLK
ncbi:hypothetical protein SAMN05421793_12116 [Epilithonimonas hominis]|uniref:Uncharacterized protein n=1 Tax=Epilithonimonas hominis TaxID=420404 RepID=A0A1H6K9Y0_9FLAO|nr:hypothetical protein SAMN05421793_12116 [Epilithonimonas hominis]